MNYEGMARLKLYKDSYCVKEEDKNIKGDYVLYVPVVTGNNQLDFHKNIYIKNVGSHTAYNVTCTTDYAGATIEFEDTTIKSKRTTKCKVKIPLTKGDTSSKTIIVKVSYDNIP